MSAHNPTSPKVIAAASGAGAGAIVGTLLLWIIGAALFGGAWDAESADATVKLVPTPLSAFVVLLLVVVGAAVPGYQTTDPARLTGDDVPAGYQDPDDEVAHADLAPLGPDDARVD